MGVLPGHLIYNCFDTYTSADLLGYNTIGNYQLITTYQWVTQWITLEL